MHLDEFFRAVGLILVVIGAVAWVASQAQSERTRCDPFSVDERVSGNGNSETLPEISGNDAISGNVSGKPDDISGNGGGERG